MPEEELENGLEESEDFERWIDLNEELYQIEISDGTD